MVCMPRVAMKGGTFRKAMTQPLMAPKMPQMTRTMIRPTNTGISGSQGSMRPE